MPWLREASAADESMRAKFLFRVESREVQDDDGVITAFRDGQVTLRENRRLDGFTLAIKEVGYQGVRVGDLVIHNMDGFAGAIGVSESDGKCTPEYTVCNGVVGRADNRFYAYVLRTMARRDYIRVICPAVRERAPRFRYPRFAEVTLPCPNYEYQVAIADFLDRKTAAIDALIEKKERLIALLAEKRAALIHQAVTKGLDPDVPMKDSGVPWIGDIPAHWMMHRLRRVVGQFIDYRGRTPEKTRSGVPLITAGAVRDGIVDHSRAPEWVTEEVCKQLSGRGKPELGDILFTSEAPLGEVGIVTNVRIACAQRIIMFKVDATRVASPFLLQHFLSESGKGEVSSRASGSTASGIRADRLKMSLVPTPPLREQVTIVSFIEQETASYSDISSCIMSQVAKLKEYRQSLITAAVTGQLEIPS
ncbi:Type I restriction-modification system, specificity subunit S [Enhygromyxa salina]|uniref:Type I restriction-modification system, specificity subunit S n=2 Tax=Enhygromyxa salina TaxID=215803 RepID=A0A0C2CXE4_9BACT|nr:Type I restriction-modification system, specificity subunit S [Enhygromyxa salina]